MHQEFLPTKGLRSKEPADVAMLFVGAPICTIVDSPHFTFRKVVGVVEDLPLPHREVVVVLRAPKLFVLRQVFHVNMSAMLNCLPELP